MKRTNIALPTVHINGTSKDAITRSYDEACDALRAFSEAWDRIEFNPRDYYPAGNWDEALAARQKIETMLREIRDYISDHREHLYDQI